MVGSGLGRFEVPIGGSPVVVPCRDDREDELKCPSSERVLTCPARAAAWHETPISSVSAGQGDSRPVSGGCGIRTHEEAHAP